MKENILLDAYKLYHDNEELCEDKLLEYKKLVENDYSTLFNNAEQYDLSFLLFTTNILLTLNLNEFLRNANIAIALYYDFCSYIDTYAIHEFFKSRNKNLQNLRDEVLQNYPGLYDDTGTAKIKIIIHRDGEDIFKNRCKLLFFEYLTRKYGEILVAKEQLNTKQVEIYNHLVQFVFKMNENLHNEEVKHVETARIKEREKIVADLSHRIKNLIYNITGNLELLDDKENAGIIRNAVKGTELICSIIEGFNYSGTGSQEDFAYDAKHHDSGVAITDILNNAIIASLENMFSGKFFNEYLHNYFKSNEDFDQAQKELGNLNKKSKDIEQFCNRWFFNCNLSYHNLAKLHIGKTKGSDIKFYIIFQELIFNAVKYSSFVDKASRILDIKVKYSETGLSFIVNNSYMPKRHERGTCLGHYIVESMVDIMGAEYNLTRNDGLYIVTVKIPNYWNNPKILNTEVN